MKKIFQSVIYQVIMMTISIVTTYYVSRIFDVSTFGTYSYTTSISTYLILFGTLGITLYAKREIAYNQNNSENKSNIFWNIIILRIIMISITIIFYYYFLIKNNEYYNYYKILLLEVIMCIFDINWFYEGIEDFKKIYIKNIFIKLFTLLCVFLLVKDNNDITIYLIIRVLSIGIGYLLFWINIKKYINKLSFKNINLNLYFKRTFLYFIPQIAVQLYTLVDKLMLGVILNDMVEIGYYEQSMKIIGMLITIITSINIVILPSLAKNYSKKDITKIKEWISKSLNFVMFIGCPMVLGLISISNKLIPMYLGNKYISVINLVNIGSILVLIIGISNVIGSQYLLACKKEKQFTLSIICGLVINVILNIILIKYKSKGVIISSVISEFTILIIQLIFIKRIYKVIDIIKISWKYILSSIIMFLILIMFNFLPLILIIILGITVYLLFLYLLKDIIFLKLRN